MADLESRVAGVVGAACSPSTSRGPGASCSFRQPGSARWASSRLTSARVWRWRRAAPATSTGERLLNDPVAVPALAARGRRMTPMDYAHRCGGNAGKPAALAVVQMLS